MSDLKLSEKFVNSTRVLDAEEVMELYRPHVEHMIDFGEAKGLIFADGSSFVRHIGHDYCAACDEEELIEYLEVLAGRLPQVMEFLVQMGLHALEETPEDINLLKTWAEESPIARAILAAHATEC